MRALFTIVFLMLICLQEVQAQEVPSNVKLLEVESLNPGFYLFLKDDSEEDGNSVKKNYVKRYSKNLFVVEVSEEEVLKKDSKGKYFSLPPDWKLAPQIKNKNPNWPLLLSVHTTDAEKFRSSSAYEVLRQYKNYFILRATKTDFTSLQEDPRVTHISEYYPPNKEAPVSFYDFSVNRINLAHHNFPGIRGNDLLVSIKEEFFDTTDIDLKNRYELFGRENQNVDQHANLIATLIAGGGNTGSRSLGVAPASHVSSSSFVDIFPAPMEYYKSNRIFVENHSYGGAIENEYGNAASAYDEIVNEVPQLVHVFSSGNSGLQSSETGTYAGVEGFANLTGNFKMAKNIISVGAVNKEKEVLARSSKGPANDGRVKPELVAYAEIGTSDAAALVSGSTLLLQDLYLEKVSRYPTVDLIKAVLVAAAEDVGPPNIDYSSGYGNLNTNGSLKIIESGAYFESEITSDEVMTFTIELPAETEELKVALSWIDPAAMPGDEVTLLNDLDLKITGPDGSSWFPWVLDGTNGETILKAAVRGRDSLNPVELVTLKAPASGSYIIEISTRKILDNQKFSVAYQISEKGKFSWTFPTMGDAIEPGKETFIRWNETLGEANGKIEFRYGEGDWELLTTSIDLAAEALKWEVPGRTGLAQLRMTVGSEIFLSDLFAVSPELRPEVLFNCDTEVLFSWEKVEGATAYIIENLGATYMEEVTVVQDTSSIISKEDLITPFVAVVPVFGEVKGRSGITINYETQGVKCYFRNFFALLGEEPEVTATLNLSTTYNIEKVEFVRKKDGAGSVIREFSPPFSSRALSVTDNDIQFGTYYFSALIYLESGGIIETQSIPVYLPGMNTLLAYPNPVKAGEILNVISRGDDLDFEIFDMQGQRVFEDQLLRFTDQLELNIPTRGLYIIRAIREGEQIGVQKIIVQ